MLNAVEGLFDFGTTVNSFFNQLELICRLKNLVLSVADFGFQFARETSIYYGLLARQGSSPCTLHTSYISNFESRIGAASL
jgi:hypothetical protein